mmetsp:Transcript_16/g.27  ORF Transcript_16/g.27 Transcript_16/m.27 type:complete len:464 (-) Transcript_16:217-1608(-)
MRKARFPQPWLSLFMSWALFSSVGNACDEVMPNCEVQSGKVLPASLAEQEEDEESDDITLLAMPQTAHRKATAPRRSGESRHVVQATRSSDATSLFQVEEIISGPDVADVQIGSEGREHVLNEPRPLQVPQASGMAAVHVDSEEKTAPETWFMVAAVAFVPFILLAWTCFFPSGKDATQVPSNPELRNLVMRLPVRSAQEISQNFAPAPQASSETGQWNSGMVVRLEGRVVSKRAQILVTPFSDRPCVMYSASSSQKRQDGVHQPPLAYHAACSDFVLELEQPDGSAPLQITVHGHDVSLFEMSKGRFNREAAFSEVPEGWRGFALAHLIHGTDASCNAMSCVDLGTKGALEFCESALLDGSKVTCVGEVARDRNGSLSLCPWRPPVAGRDSPQQPKSRVDSLRTAFLDMLSASSWGAPGRISSALAGQVLISDSSDFIDSSSPFWRRIMQGPTWQTASLLVS